jgi:hypothetical protein
MPRQPRALGYTAHQTITSAERNLATVDRLLEPQSRGDVNRPELVATKARFGIAETRRLLVTVLGLGVAKPKEEEKP